MATVIRVCKVRMTQKGREEVYEGPIMFGPVTMNYGTYLGDHGWHYMDKGIWGKTIEGIEYRACPSEVPEVLPLEQLP